MEFWDVLGYFLLFFGLSHVGNRQDFQVVHGITGLGDPWATQEIETCFWRQFLQGLDARGGDEVDLAPRYVKTVKIQHDSASNELHHTESYYIFFSSCFFASLVVKVSVRPLSQPRNLNHGQIGGKQKAFFSRPLYCWPSRGTWAGLVRIIVIQHGALSTNQWKVWPLAFYLYWSFCRWDTDCGNVGKWPTVGWSFCLSQPVTRVSANLWIGYSSNAECSWMF